MAIGGLAAHVLAACACTCALAITMSLKRRRRYYVVDKENASHYATAQDQRSADAKVFAETAELFEMCEPRAGNARDTSPCLIDLSDFGGHPFCEKLRNAIEFALAECMMQSVSLYVKFCSSGRAYRPDERYVLRVLRIRSSHAQQQQQQQQQQPPESETRMSVSKQVPGNRARGVGGKSMFLTISVGDDEMCTDGILSTLVLHRVMPRVMRLIPCTSGLTCSSIVRIVRGFFKPSERDADPLFVDVLPLLSNPRAFDFLLEEGVSFVNALTETTCVLTQSAASVTAVVALETRGFMFGATLAHRLGVSFVPLRRTGTYPGRLVVRQDFIKASGPDSIELDGSILGEQERVVLVDDLLASGASLLAASSVLRAADARVEGAFVPVEIHSGRGRMNLWKYEAHWPVRTIVQIDELHSAPRIENIRDARTLLEGRSASL